MLRMTRVQLNLVSDIDIYLLFEKDMAGHFSYIFKRYRQANDK